MLHQLYPQDKRKNRRLPAANLTAQLKTKQGLFTTWSDLSVSDFSLFGVALILPSEPELGRKITLRLLLTMDMGDIRINQIEAKIVNKLIREDGNWRVGLIFSSQSKQSSDTKAQLKRFQEILEKNEALVGRLSEIAV